MKNTADWLKKILRNVDDRGYLKARENSRLEFKESFVFQNIAKYFKAIGAFANTKGGVLLFGIKDQPRLPVGIDREKFDSIQQDKISTFLAEYFSPQIEWNLDIVEVDDQFYGYIQIFECENKPAICKKTKDNTLRDGDIYYRYRGQSKVIAFPELRAIHDEVRRKERKLWMKHIERIGKMGPQNVAFIDLFDGTIQAGKKDGRLLIDDDLLSELKKQVKFLEEGKFVKKDGAPALKLVGEIISTKNVIVPDLDPNKDYPYLAKHLAQELGLRPYDIQTLIWKYDLKGNKRYHIHFETGRSSVTHKYSEFALKFLRSKLSEMVYKKEKLRTISNEYSNRIKINQSFHKTR